MTLPEVLLWRRLRNHQLDDFLVRRQHPVGPYVLDFYVDRGKLAIEVDGGFHHVEDRPERDAARDAWLAERGIRTLRLSARLVLSDMDTALRTIRNNLPDVTPRPRQARCRPSPPEETR